MVARDPAGQPRPQPADQIRSRKLEHVKVALGEDVSGRPAASWADVALVHQSLPEVDLDRIDLSTSFLGRSLPYPVVISSMTGGHAEVKAVNEVLARVAHQLGLAMGVGSQRAAVKDPSLAHTYSVVRELAPSAFLIANVGAPQLIDQPGHAAFTLDEIDQAVAMIGADALAVHLNVLQEATQPEGDRRSVGCTAALAALTRRLPLPVIAKETGAGVCREQAGMLAACGVAAIDVGGAGGSSMALIEMHRSRERDDDHTAELGSLFGDWGLPTPISVVEATGAGLPLIATGGIRSGLDAAKALALGSTLVGLGAPLLRAAVEGEAAVRGFLDSFLDELRVAMFLTGAAAVADLGGCDVVVGGEAGRWLDRRGFDLRALAQRRRGRIRPPD